MNGIVNKTIISIVVFGRNIENLTSCLTMPIAKVFNKMGVTENSVIYTVRTRVICQVQESWNYFDR
jgi:hypothetical protein